MIRVASRKRIFSEEEVPNVIFILGSREFIVSPARVVWKLRKNVLSCFQNFLLVCAKMNLKRSHRRIKIFFTCQRFVSICSQAISFVASLKKGARCEKAFKLVHFTIPVDVFAWEFLLLTWRMKIRQLLFKGIETNKKKHRRGWLNWKGTPLKNVMNWYSISCEFPDQHLKKILSNPLRLHLSGSNRNRGRKVFFVLVSFLMVSKMNIHEI